MICLTGDVHQEFGSGEQEHYEGTEFEATLEYIEILREYQLDITLFLTGVVAEENRERVQELSKEEFIEIGGHTWSAFRPQWLHQKIFSKVAGSIYGPKLFQKRDIKRTLQTLRALSDEPITSWRTHAYRSTSATYDILSDTSIEFVSDLKAPDERRPFHYDDRELIEFPINVITDHEHLVHASRDRAAVKQLQKAGWSDEFGSESYVVDDWTDLVISKIDRVEQEGGLSTILVHPGCMKAADNFSSFERLCSHISSRGYETRKMEDAANHLLD